MGWERQRWSSRELVWPRRSAPGATARASRTARRMQTPTRRRRPNPAATHAKVNVSGADGRRYAQVGTDQEAQGDNPHAADVLVTPNGQKPGRPGSGPSVGLPTLDTNWKGSKPSGAPVVQPQVHAGTPDGSAAALLTGSQLYLGADDNLDVGEHDGANGQYGTSKAVNGPSDGGNISVTTGIQGTRPRGSPTSWSSPTADRLLPSPRIRCRWLTRAAAGAPTAPASASTPPGEASIRAGRSQRRELVPGRVQLSGQDVGPLRLQQRRLQG